MNLNRAKNTYQLNSDLGGKKLEKNIIFGKRSGKEKEEGI